MRQPPLRHRAQDAPRTLRWQRAGVAAVFCAIGATSPEATAQTAEPVQARVTSAQNQAANPTAAGSAGVPSARGLNDLLDAAIAEFALQHFEEALSLFSQAHARHPTARTHRALAKCHFELRDYVRSAASAAAAIHAQAEPLSPEMRQEILALRERALGFVGYLAWRFESDKRAEVLIEIDGVPTPLESAPIALNVGTHNVVVRSAADRESHRVRTVGGETITLHLGGGERVAPSASSGAAVPWGWVAAGTISAVSLAISIPYAFGRVDAARRCSNAESVGASCSNGDAVALERTLGISLAVLSAAALATSAIGFSLNFGSRKSNKIACAGAPGGFACNLQVHWQ